MLRNVKSVFLNITLKSAVENTPFGIKPKCILSLGFCVNQKKKNNLCTLSHSMNSRCVYSL